jgi:hypothetical protein
MKFDIRSYEGVGPIRFGMTPSKVRAALGMEFENFRRGGPETYPCDYYKGLQCFVYYDDKHGLVDAVEFAEPAQPTLNGLNLLGLPFADMITRIRELDADVAVENDGFTSLHLGVGGYAPNQDEPELPSETIIVFVRDYYG